MSFDFFVPKCLQTLILILYKFITNPHFLSPQEATCLSMLWTNYTKDKHAAMVVE